MKKNLSFLLLFCFLFAFSQPALSTISTLSNQNVFYGNGATTVFTANFVPYSANNIQVILTNSNGEQTTLLPSQYLIAINPIPAGSLWATSFTVTYPLSGSPLASGNTLTITRILPLQQDTDISNQGNFYPTVVEQALDTELMQTQQVNARTGQIRGTWLTGTLYNYGDIVVDGANGADTGNLYAAAIPNTSGTWSTDLSNGDWSLALNVQGIVNTLPQINNNQVFGNISGSTSQPYGVGVSALIDSAIGNTQGDILYRSGSTWSVLAPGTNGQVLETQGAGANPQWISGSGSGTITGVATTNGLSGGGSTGNVTVGLASVASNSLLANTTSGTASPSATTLSAYLDAVLGATQGAIIYRGGTTWNELTPGSNGQFLQTGGSAANPAWGQTLPNGATATTQTSTDNSTKVATTAFVQTAVSSGGLPSALGVGSYVMASNGGSAVSAGSTASGATLTSYIVIGGTAYIASGDSLSGTWRAMQSLPASGGGINNPIIGLWQRIS
jgi:hypothetical protein